MTKLKKLLRCYAMGMDSNVADALLDRIVHDAHQIELTGESIRKMNAKKTAK